MMKLSVIIPVFNEVNTIETVIDKVRNCGVKDLQIILVDDYSTDGTVEKLKELQKTHNDLDIFFHEKNSGKGSAIRTAQQHIKGDVVVIQDADLEYDPVEFPGMLEPIENDIADVVYGSRYSGNKILVDTFVHYLGNKILTLASNIFTNLHLSDMETCYKMIKADIFKGMTLEANRFGIEPEMTAKFSKLRCRIYEIPISYRARDFGEGKKIGWKDGVAAFWYIFKYNVLK
jgi:glycosyltransferase involved in cell wall biosynthesis